MSDVKDSVVGRLSHPASSTSHLQPFTAPWLAEVARITPTRPEHIAFAHPNAPPPPSHPTTSMPDYYPHFSNLPPRSTYYSHPMFSAPHPYLRDYQPRPPMRPFPLLDPRHTADVQVARSQPHPSQLIPHVRPLGPPPPPPPVAETSTRDLRESRLDASFSVTSDSSHRSVHGEPSPKRRNTHSSFQFPPPLPSQRRTHSKPSTSAGPSEAQAALSPDEKSHNSGSSKTSSTPRPPKTVPARKKQPSGPYYPHFQKGALVSFGSEVRRVEDMRTEDFVIAANATEDLTLDPPSVSSIVMAASGDTATISFNFASRNREVCDERTLKLMLLLMLYVPQL